MFNLILAAAAEQTWLATQLETYGVPAGISAGIGIIVGYGLTWIISRGLRKTSGLLTKVFSAGTTTLQTADANITKLIVSNQKLVEENKQTITGLMNQVTGLVNEIIELKSKVSDYQSEVVSLHNEIAAQKSELQNGALKIIKLLTEGTEASNA